MIATAAIIIALVIQLFILHALRALVKNFFVWAEDDMLRKRR